MITEREPTPVHPASREEDSAFDGSRLASARRAVLGLTEILEESVELFGATLREEVERIPSRWIPPLIGLCSCVAGAGFLTAAAGLYFRNLFGGWAPSFLAIGIFYFVLGLIAWKTARRGAR